MSDMINYLDWRGDIEFQFSQLNEIDALIFCQLSYLNFKNAVSESFSEKTSIKDALEKIKSLPDAKERKNPGAVINPATWTLLEKCASSKRFSKVLLCGYSDKYEVEATEQFSALTFETESFAFTAFRGTDDTMVGWNEDFNLAYMDKVPAQEDALLYLEKAMASTDKKTYVGGHSKGGNLAVYSTSCIQAELSERITSVYNFDGPGFRRNFLESEGFRRIGKKLLSFVPEFSIIGMLFSHMERYVTVKSMEKGIMQHDPFSWMVYGPKFDSMRETNKDSKYIEKTINGWMNKLELEQKRDFVQSLFGLLRDTGIRTNTDLANMNNETVLQLIKNLSGSDKETRKMVFDTFKLLAQTAIEGIKLTQ